MRRVGNLYSRVIAIDNLIAAHRNACKGKKWYIEVKAINKDPIKYLSALQHTLINHTYHTSTYHTFIKREGGKERLIYKLPYYPDRICQWALMQVVAPYLLRRMTADTYSALPTRGIHKALNKVRKDIANNAQDCQYCLKMDIHHYYQSINHEILKRQFRKVFKDKDVLYLLDEIIDSVSTGEQDGVGIPIGNYLSQWAGNFYLSALDHWIKEEKRIKFYYRYMDDIVILHSDKTLLHSLFREIETYLKDKLKLQVKSNWQVFPTYIRGIDFVGYRIFKGFTLLRKSSAIKFKRRMIRINKKAEVSYSDLCSIASYKGWLKHCNSRRLTNKYLKGVA